MRNRILSILALIVAGLLTLTINSCTEEDLFTIKEVVVTWANPANIIDGLPLTEAHLNATANVPGTFVFEPEIGTVLAKGSQTLTAVFTPTNSKFAAVTKTVTVNVVDKLVPVITWANPIDISVGTALSATQLNATANVPGTFVYTPALGTVLAKGDNQVLSVTFTPTAIEYQPASKTVTINVTEKQTPEITWANPANITYPTALSATQLNATTTVAGTFTYTPADGTVLSVGDNQALTVNFTPDNTNLYNVASKTVYINVKALTVTDIDGNVYNTIIVGDKVWTVENLRVTKYRNGEAIPEVAVDADWAGLSTGAYCVYPNQAGYAATYGLLYNWFTIADPRNIAPEGWHVATAQDYQDLADAFGGNPSAGPAMKEAGTAHWADPNNGTNASGFTALGSGTRSETGVFGSFNTFGQFWTATENAANTTQANIRSLQGGATAVNFPTNPKDKRGGRNIRLVKD